MDPHWTHDLFAMTENALTITSRPGKLDLQDLIGLQYNVIKWSVIEVN